MSKQACVRGLEGAVLHALVELDRCCSTSHVMDYSSQLYAVTRLFAYRFAVTNLATPKRSRRTTASLNTGRDASSPLSRILTNNFLVASACSWPWVCTEAHQLCCEGHILQHALNMLDRRHIAKRLRCLHVEVRQPYSCCTYKSTLYISWE